MMAEGAAIRPREMVAAIGCLSLLAAAIGAGLTLLVLWVFN